MTEEFAGSRPSADGIKLGSPKGGAIRGLWLGLILIVFGFAVKQILVSTAMWNVSTMLEYPKLDAERSAEYQRLPDDLSRQERTQRRDEIHDRYEERMRDLRAQTNEAAVSSLSKLQWFLNLKIALDLCRLAGAILIIVSALHIAVDRQNDTWIKAYAVCCAIASLISMTIGGLFTMVS